MTRINLDKPKYNPIKNVDTIGKRAYCELMHRCLDSD